jgi:hypothetical protein
MREIKTPRINIFEELEPWFAHLPSLYNQVKNKRKKLAKSIDLSIQPLMGCEWLVGLHRLKLRREFMEGPEATRV